MAMAFSSLPTHQSNSDVPYEIYHLLLQIAKFGYDAEDVKTWYTNIVTHLLRTDSVNLETTYPDNTSFANSTSIPLNVQRNISNNGNASAIDSTFGRQSFFDGAAASLQPWSDSFTYDGFSSTEALATTAASSQPVYQSAINHQIPPSPMWSPRTTALPTTEASGFTTAPETSLPTDITSFSNWSDTDTLDTLENVSRKRKASHTPPYQMAISSTAMPLLVPTSHSPPRNYHPTFTPEYTSTEITYLPPISIIPARKRRKTASKGVKRFIQPLHVSRQSI